MNDKELLELAAKAAGMVNPNYMEIYQNKGVNRGPAESLWNPLTDDGDALRLAVKLGIGFSFGIEEGRVVASHFDSAYGEWERIDKDPYAATRRAIVRAAAEIGRAMV